MFNHRVPAKSGNIFPLAAPIGAGACGDVARAPRLAVQSGQDGGHGSWAASRHEALEALVSSALSLFNGDNHRAPS